MYIKKQNRNTSKIIYYQIKRTSVALKIRCVKKVHPAKTSVLSVRLRGFHVFWGPYIHTGLGHDWGGGRCGFGVWWWFSSPEHQVSSPKSRVFRKVSSLCIVILEKVTYWRFESPSKNLNPLIYQTLPFRTSYPTSRNRTQKFIYKFSKSWSL